ncbi:methyltransferase helicase [Blueberry necrotic ring blotch virus]|uniref:Methyltransferase helicase n=1 Tax=Blueberry necrotic ring blotch virus TaxID=1094249 RepID=G5DFC6_9VIRU|nr:methyltransferase helicase [Blueberry necrotic ring blotch virus]AEQ55299.1 methyltransferase helicase [Blueberry necrotic ring blotch virus]
MTTATIRSRFVEEKSSLQCETDRDGGILQSSNPSYPVCNEVDEHLATLSGVTDDIKEHFLRDALLRNAMVSDHLKSSIQQNLLAQASQRRARTPRYVKYCNEDDAKFLQVSFPVYRIERREAADFTPHGYARDSRALDTWYAYDHILKYKPGYTLDSHYDVYCKEVGANLAFFASAGEYFSNVHLCMPVLNHKDQFRHVGFRQLANEKAAIAALNPRHNPHIHSFNNNGLLTCFKKSEYCTVKAMKVNISHVYDLSVNMIAGIIDSSHAKEVCLTMLFDSRMWIENSGLLPRFNMTWEKFKVLGRTRIRFFFLNDTNPAFDHDFDVYTHVLRTRVIRTPEGRVFLVNQDRLVNYTVVVQMIQAVGNYIPPETIVQRFPLLSDIGFKVLKTFRYDTLTNETYIHIRTIPNNFYERIYSILSSCKQETFTIQHTNRVIQSLNSSVVTGGLTTAGPNMDPDELLDISTSIYHCLWRRFFEQGKTVSSMSSEEQKLRALNSSSAGVTGFFYYLWKVFWVMHKDKLPISEVITPEALDAHLSSSAAINHDSWGVQFLKHIGLKPSRRFNLQVLNLTVIELYNYIEEIQLEKDNPLSFSGPIDYNSALLHSASQSPIDGPTLQIVRDMHNETIDFCDNCAAELNPITVPGDGNCFYNAFLKCIGSTASPNTVRQRLMDSRFLPFLCMTKIGDNYVVSAEKVTALRDRLRPDNKLGPEKWVNNDVVVLTAYEYEVTICIHKVGSHCRINRKSVIGSKDTELDHIVHLELVDKHYSALLPVEYSPAADQVDLSNYSNESSQMELMSLDGWSMFSIHEAFAAIPIFERKYGPTGSSLLTKDYRFESKYVEASILSSSFSNIPNSYRSFYGPMLAQCMDHFREKFGSLNSNVYDVHQANGCPTRVLADYYLASGIVRVNFSGSKEMVLDAVTNTAAVARTLSVPRRNLNPHIKGTIDFLLINPMVFLDALMYVDLQRYHEYLIDCYPLFSSLSVKGNVVMCVPKFIELPTLKMMYLLSKFFEEVTVYFPSCVPDHIPYCFWVFQTKLEEKEQKDKLPERITEAIDNSPDECSGAFAYFIDSVVATIGESCDAAVQRIINYASDPTTKCRLDAKTLKACEIFYMTKFVIDDDTPLNSNERAISSVDVEPRIVSGEVRESVIDTISISPLGLNKSVSISFESESSGTSSSDPSSRIWASSKDNIFTRSLSKVQRTTRLTAQVTRNVVGNAKVVRDSFFGKFKFCEKWVETHVGEQYQFRRHDMYMHIFSRDVYDQYLKYLKIFDFEQTIQLEYLVSRYRTLSIKDNVFEVKYLLVLLRNLYNFLQSTQNVQPYVVFNIPRSQFGQHLCTSFFFKLCDLRFFMYDVLPILDSTPVVKNDPQLLAPLVTPIVDTVVKNVRVVIPCVNEEPTALVVESKEVQEHFEDDTDMTGGFLKDAYEDCMKNSYRPVLRDYSTHLSQVVKTTLAKAKDLSTKVVNVYNSVHKSEIKNNLMVVWGEDYDSAYINIKGKQDLFGGFAAIGKDNSNRYFVPIYQSAGTYSIGSVRRAPNTSAVDGPYCTFECLSVFTELDIYRNLNTFEFHEVEKQLSTTVFSIVQAGPGCGKTYDIVRRLVDAFLSGTVSLMAVLKSRNDYPSVKQKFEKQIKDKKLSFNKKKIDEFLTSHVTSIDSILMAKLHTYRHETLLFDEAMISHPGKILYACFLTGCKYAECYGDVMQIPFIDRTNSAVPCQYPETAKCFPISRVMDVSFRCPGDIVRFLAPKYKRLYIQLGMSIPADETQLFRTHSAVGNSVEVKKISGISDVKFLPSDYIILTFTQVEKTTIAQQKTHAVHTIHEYQGLEARNIAIVRLNTLNAYENTFNIYESEHHIVTGISRHTVSLKYLTVIDTDHLSKLLKEIEKYTF